MLTVTQKFLFKGYLQKIFHLLGYQIIRYKKDVNRNNSDNEIKRMLKKLSSVDTIFDVGANEGNTIKKYSEWFPNAKIYGFEPHPDVLPKLLSNLKNFKNIEIVQKGVSDSSKSAVFYCNNLEDSSSLLKSKQINDPQIDGLLKTTKEVDVELTSLDEFANMNNIKKVNFLKMDIQGGELSALKGAKKLLESKRIDIIYVEVNFALMYENQPLFHDISLKLHEYGYTLLNIYNQYYTPAGELLFADALFYDSSFINTYKPNLV